jgi:hypothetical protein
MYEINVVQATYTELKILDNPIIRNLPFSIRFQDNTYFKPIPMGLDTYACIFIYMNE